MEKDAAGPRPNQTELVSPMAAGQRNDMELENQNQRHEKPDPPGVGTSLQEADVGLAEQHQQMHPGQTQSK